MKTILCNKSFTICTEGWLETFWTSSLSEASEESFSIPKKRTKAQDSLQRFWRFFSRKRDEWLSSFVVVWRWKSPVMTLQSMARFNSCPWDGNDKPDTVFGMTGWCPRNKIILVETQKTGFLGKFLLRINICEVALKNALCDSNLEAEAELLDDTDEGSFEEALRVIKASISEIEDSDDRATAQSKLEDLLNVILTDDVQIFIGCLRRIGTPSKTVGINLLLNETSQMERTAEEFRRGYPAVSLAAVFKVAYACVIQSETPKSESDVLKILRSSSEPTFDSFLDLARTEMKAVSIFFFSFSPSTSYSLLVPPPYLSGVRIHGRWPRKIQQVCAGYETVLL